MLDIYLLDIRKPLHYESWNSQKLKWGVQVFGTVDGKDGDGSGHARSPPTGRYCDREKSSASSRGSMEVEFIPSGAAAETGVTGVSPLSKMTFISRQSSAR